jgi:hypothetical protein
MSKSAYQAIRELDNRSQDIRKIHGEDFQTTRYILPADQSNRSSANKKRDARPPKELKSDVSIVELWFFS